jgi:hypothetical protein
MKWIVDYWLLEHDVWVDYWKQVEADTEEEAKDALMRQEPLARTLTAIKLK